MEYLCIFHDQIGGRTSKPQIKDQTKVNSVSGQLTIFVLRMLTHGHKDYVYAHYDITIWLGDSKYDSSSICHIMCVGKVRCEGGWSAVSKEVAWLLFRSLLLGLFGLCAHSRPHSNAKDNSLGATDPKNFLPNNLYLQLDKFVKDNKNNNTSWWHFDHCSLHIPYSKKSCDDFLMLATHEDVDKYYLTKVKGAKTSIYKSSINLLLSSTVPHGA